MFIHKVMDDTSIYIKQIENMFVRQKISLQKNISRIDRYIKKY